MREHDSFLFWSINLLIMVAILCAVVLNPLHKKNIEKLQQNTYITSPWISENKGQEYTLKHGDWVFFWKSDEKPVRVGMVYVLWGYYRIIAHKDGMTEFRDVEWCNANF